MTDVVRIDEAEASLRAELSSRGLLDVDDVRATTAAMLEWYERVRATDAAPLDEDGDMLLFQWAEHDPGDGRRFEVDLTRQLVRADDPEDEGIVHVSLTFRYPVSDATAALGRGHRWCHDPAGLAELREALEAYPVTAFAWSSRPIELVLASDVAG